MFLGQVDNAQQRINCGLLLSITVGTNYSESYSYDNLMRVSSVTRTIEGRNYTTSYQYNGANQTTQTTYPSGRVIGFGHDLKGRLTSVGSYLSVVIHNGIGQVTSQNLGNGVTESFAYDSHRMQLITQNASKDGVYLRMLSYNYQGVAGQSGAGSTAGNSGQLMSMFGTLGGSDEGGLYNYDGVARLVSSSQTSNGESAERRFAYDRWGNRTGVWDAMSGGNQIQMQPTSSSGRVALR
jgi:YD repeat-containing protein